MFEVLNVVSPHAIRDKGFLTEMTRPSGFKKKKGLITVLIPSFLLPQRPRYS